MAAALAEGFLKQQGVDASGLLTWERRYLRLTETGELVGSADAAEPASTAVSVLGIRLAREWRVSSPAAGFGFDVVWASGTLWSFLAASAAASKAWVAAFNAIAQRSTADKSSDVTQTVDQSPLRLPGNRRDEGDSNTTPVKLGSSPSIHRIADRASQGSGEGNRGHRDSSAQVDLSPDHGASETASLRARVQELERELAVAGRLAEEKLRAQERRHMDEVGGLRSDLASRHPQQRPQGEIAAAEAAAFARQRDLQARLEGLQDELAAQVRRSEALEERLRSRNDRAEAQESDLRAELSGLAERFRAAQEAMEALAEERDAEVRSLEQTFNEETARLLGRVRRLEGELERAGAAREELVGRRLGEAEERFRDAQRTCEEEVRASMRRELESAHTKELAALQRKSGADVARAVAEERRLAADQVEALRRGFLKREQELAADVDRLEQLHRRRVEKLDSQLSESRLEQRRLSEALQELREAENVRAQEAKRRLEATHSSAVSQAAQASELSSKLAALQRLLQESKCREQSYRDQLSQTLEENQTMRGELTELRRVAAEGSFHSHQWRSAMRELELSRVTAESCLQISQDEVRMLEVEVSRLKNENNDLRGIVNRSDNIIYGKAKRSTANKENGRNGSVGQGSLSKARKDFLI